MSEQTTNVTSGMETPPATPEIIESIKSTSPNDVVDATAHLNQKNALTNHTVSSKLSEDNSKMVSSFRKFKSS